MPAADSSLSQALAQILQLLKRHPLLGRCVCQRVHGTTCCLMGDDNALVELGPIADLRVLKARPVWHLEVELVACTADGDAVDDTILACARPAVRSRAYTVLVAWQTHSTQLQLILGGLLVLLI